jgi:hypothetical protein
VKTFEDAWSLVTSPSYIYNDKMLDIVEDFARYLERAKLPIPSEVQTKQNSLSDDV